MLHLIYNVLGDIIEDNIYPIPLADLSVLDDDDIVVVGITLGDIIDDTELTPPSVDALMDYLNVDFKALHPEVTGVFNISAGNHIYYSNPEQFTSGTIYFQIQNFSNDFSTDFQ